MSADANHEPSISHAIGNPAVIGQIKTLFQQQLVTQECADGMPTLWVSAEHISSLLALCKHQLQPAYSMLYDVTAIDERVRCHRDDQPASDFTVVYQLLSLEGNAFLRLKVALLAANLRIDSQCDL